MTKQITATTRRAVNARRQVDRSTRRVRGTAWRVGQCQLAGVLASGVFAFAAGAQTVTLYDLRNNLPGVQGANLRVSAMEDTESVADSNVAVIFTGDGRVVNWMEVYFVDQSGAGTPNAWTSSNMDFRVTGRYAGSSSFAASPYAPTGPNDWAQGFDTPANADWLTPLYTSSTYNVYRGEFFFPAMSTVAGQVHAVTWSGYGNLFAAGRLFLLFSNNSNGSFGASNDWRWLSGNAAISLTAAGAPFPTVAARIGYVPFPTFAQQPADAIACAASPSADFSVAMLEDSPLRPGLYHYHWQWQPEAGAAWTDLVDGVNTYLGQPALDVTGATEASVHPRVLWGLGGNLPFRCIVSNACGSATSDAADLRVCLADVNCDQTVDLADFFEFLNCFDQTLPCADIDGSGEVDLGDFFGFLNAFDGSC